MPTDWCTGGDPNNSTQVQVWVFDIEKDPTESHNLAQSQPALLGQMVAAFEEYQKGAVDDISCTKGVVDPAADPPERPLGLCDRSADGHPVGEAERYAATEPTQDEQRGACPRS